MAETFKVVIIAKLTTLTWVSVPWFAFAAACDLVIAAVQVVFLHRHRSGLPRTNRLIKILSLYILSTGLLTSVVAIVELTSFAAIGFNFPLVFLSVAMGALYVVSFLANLDSRRIVRGIDNDSRTLGSYRPENDAGQSH
ncbi:hypothetical protein H2248_005498 [Termitomyces sp. 'cryptogamus']|nr:hypothetical protein H2248_005498 [Termitomyces sp. 'cryptogamus']